MDRCTERRHFGACRPAARFGGRGLREDGGFSRTRRLADFGPGCPHRRGPDSRRHVHARGGGRNARAPRTAPGAGTREKSPEPFFAAPADFIDPRAYRHDRQLLPGARARALFRTGLPGGFPRRGRFGAENPGAGGPYRGARAPLWRKGPGVLCAARLLCARARRPRAVRDASVFVCLYAQPSVPEAVAAGEGPPLRRRGPRQDAVGQRGARLCRRGRRLLYRTDAGGRPDCAGGCGTAGKMRAVFRSGSRTAAKRGKGAFGTYAVGRHRRVARQRRV